MDSRVTSKGQVTVPKMVREALGILPGDRLSFCVHEDGTVTVEAETADLADLRGAVRHTGKPVSVAQMNEAIRGAASRL